MEEGSDGYLVEKWIVSYIGDAKVSDKQRLESFDWTQAGTLLKGLEKGSVATL
jgi:hypothetical protein